MDFAQPSNFQQLITFPGRVRLSFNQFWLHCRTALLTIGFVILSACSQQETDLTVNLKTGFAINDLEVVDPYGREALFSYPDFAGKYAVATHSLILSDQSRIEPFEKDSIENRKIQIRFFYPTSAEINRHSNSNKLPVIAEGAWQYLIGHQQFSGKKLRYDNYRNARWNISLDQKIAVEQPSYPVLVFSHGYGYSAEYYSAMSAELASKGFIVVSINHTYGANPSDMGNNDLVWAKPLSKESTGAYLPIWSDDQLFVIDQLELINGNPNSLFYQKLDLANLGIFGHSYGGAASYYSASRDQRIKAVIDIDGTIFDYEDRYISQPFAFILSKNHHPKFNFSNAGNIAYELRLPSFEHASFSDHILWWQWDHDDYKLGIGEVNAQRAVELTSELVNDFFSTYLLSKESSWFRNANVVTDEVILVRKN